MDPCSPLSLSIADIHILVRTEEERLRFHAPGPIAKFLSPPHISHHLELMTTLSDLSQEPKGEFVFDSGGVWKLYQAGKQSRFLLSSPQIASHPYKAAFFDSDQNHGTVALHHSFFAGKEAVYPLEYPLDELLMIRLLGAGRGMLVHACGVVDQDGRGYLFAGQSGAGKTTIARLWEQEQGCSVLSDDRIILRKKENQIHMYGTPWHGEAELSSQEGVPLSSLFILRQAKANCVVPLKSAEMVALLMARTFPPFYSASGVEFTMQFCEQLVESFPCFELQFRPVPDVISTVRSVIESSTPFVRL